MIRIPMNSMLLKEKEISINSSLTWLQFSLDHQSGDTIYDQDRQQRR